MNGLDILGLLLGDPVFCCFCVFRSAGTQLIYSKLRGDQLVWKSRLRCGELVDDKGFCVYL